LRQSFDWKGLRKMVVATCKKCLLGTHCVSTERKGKSDSKLWCLLTVIDPATGWFEMKQIQNKIAAEVADICETMWFTRHPLPQRITLDRGAEFMAEFAKMATEDNGLKLKPVTTRNLQASALIERIHQTIGNVMRAFEVQAMDEDLAATSHASHCSSSLINAISVRVRCCLKHQTHSPTGNVSDKENNFESTKMKSVRTSLDASTPAPSKTRSWLRLETIQNMN
jgi:hypothetical protein